MDLRYIDRTIGTGLIIIIAYHLDVTRLFQAS